MLKEPQLNFANVFVSAVFGSLICLFGGNIPKRQTTLKSCKKRHCVLQISFPVDVKHLVTLLSMKPHCMIIDNFGDSQGCYHFLINDD